VPIYEDIRTLNEEVLGNTKQQRGESGGLQQEDKPEALQGRDSLDTPIPAGKGARNAPTSNDREPIYADVITGGYPCQPFSRAGKRRGTADDRHLWPEMYRIIKAVRPRWVIAENVYGHISMGLDQVLSDLEGINYAWWTFIVPACAVDAPHRRDRVWIIANTESCGGNRAPNEASPSPQRQNGKQTQQSSKHGKIQSVADPKSKQDWGVQQPKFQPNTGARGEIVQTMADPSTVNVQGQQPEFLDQKIREIESQRQAGSCGDGFRRWAVEPAVGRVADGIPGRVAQLKALGNAVVPQIPEQIGYAILEAENEKQKAISGSLI